MTAFATQEASAAQFLHFIPMEIVSAVMAAVLMLTVWGKFYKSTIKCEYFKSHSASADLQMYGCRVHYEMKNIRYKTNTVSC